MAATTLHDEPVLADHKDHGHPSDAKYWQIAAALAVVTAIEVALSYIDLGNATNPLLLLGMVIKFYVVAAFFMHLKFDSKVLRRLLISGLVLACGCYLAMLFMFRQFGEAEDKPVINLVESGITAGPQP